MNHIDNIEDALNFNQLMIISTKIEEDCFNIKRYVDVCEIKRIRAVIIAEEKYYKILCEKLKSYILNKRVDLIHCEELDNGIEKLVKLKETILEKGYKTAKIIGLCAIDSDKKLSFIEFLAKQNFEYCCYYNVVDISLEYIAKLDKYFKYFLFEQTDEVEVYSNNQIKELEIILKSIQSSVKSKKNNYNNVKKLKQLNILLTSAHKSKSVDEFLKNFLSFIMETSDCGSGGILTKTKKNKFDTFYFVGKEATYIEELVLLNKKENIVELKNEDEFIIFLNVNEYTVIYLLFENTTNIDKNIFEIGLLSARNIIISFLEKLKNENTIIQNEKLKALGEISSGIAHDFNDVLATISGYVTLSQVKNHDKVVNEYLDIISRASLDGAEMLRRIQEFTKNIKDEEVNCFEINKLINSVINMIKPKISEKKLMGLDIAIQCQLNASGCISGRESGIREVIINLINNAIDAMPIGGNINIISYNRNNKIVIEVEDCGTGMDESVIANIFEPFFSTKGVNGNGIGLSVSQKIIKEHGGNIYVVSELGQGSKFIVTLPAEENKNENNNNLTSDDEKYDCRVLVVDDKVWVAMAVGEIFKNFVKHVDICYSGKDAIDKISNGNFGLVISDLAMPNMNGLKIAKYAKDFNKNIKFVLMTGWLGSIEDYESNLVDYILEKPFGVDEIRDLLKKYK